MEIKAPGPGYRFTLLLGDNFRRANAAAIAGGMIADMDCGQHIVGSAQGAKAGIKLGRACARSPERSVLLLIRGRGLLA